MRRHGRLPRGVPRQPGAGAAVPDAGLPERAAALPTQDLPPPYAGGDPEK